MKRTTVLLADDHALVRSGLRALLETQLDIQVIGEADDGVSAVTACAQLRPDVVLMDLGMPGQGGIRATEDITKQWPLTRVVVLTMHNDIAYVRLARLAGAAGFVLKQALATDLVNAIREVRLGKLHFPPESEMPSPKAGLGPLELLSDREREVLSLIALGHTTPEIARKLSIGEKTVETHRAHITEKLELRTRADLVRFALEHGLLKA